MAFEDGPEFSVMLIKRYEEMRHLKLIQFVDTDDRKLINRSNNPNGDTCMKKGLCDMNVTGICPNKVRVCFTQC